MSLMISDLQLNLTQKWKWECFFLSQTSKFYLFFIVFEGLIKKMKLEKNTIRGNLQQLRIIRALKSLF